MIRRLLSSEDFRTDILTLINAEFLQYAIEFFGKVALAKLSNQEITDDWYRYVFLNDKLPSDDLIINSGLNKKTIANSYKTTERATVLVAHQ
jgi:hypothetical protein